MDWVSDYQLFLFDFDGLLVNTEELHYRAYQKMCADRGYQLTWDFPAYCLNAHYSQEKLREGIFKNIPQLENVGWDTLYSEKKKAMVDLLENEGVTLMPGVEKLLDTIEQKGVQRCVVTNSPKEVIDLIIKDQPLLKSIPHWFTRETYSQGKPHPECYLNAIKSLSKVGDRIIGFEDTPRGLQALMQTSAVPIFITNVPYPDIQQYQVEGVKIFSSLDQFLLCQ